MAGSKRKRVSKKTKKSWRKHVDIKDVEDFLEDQRLEERTGLKVSTLRDEDLFQIDTSGGDSQVPAPAKNEEKEKEETTETCSPFRLRETTTPTSFKILERRSAVSDPIAKRNKPKLKKSLQDRLQNGILTAKERVALKMSKKKELMRRRKPKIGDFKFDVWEKENVKKLDKHSEWLTNDTVRHTLFNTGERKKLVPKSIKEKTSLLPAVEAPHPGLSYNPSLKDHQDILTQVAESEKKLIKEEKHIKRVTTDMFSKVDEKVAQKEWLEEMSSGLIATKDSDDEVITGDYTTVNPPVKNKKKTLQKRRKLREAAQLKEKIRQMKIEKKKLSDIYKLRFLNAEIKKKEKKSKILKKKREKLKEQKRFQTKQLSHTKYEEPLEDFTAPKDLTGNLRGIKTTTNLLLDRYNSMKKRNILEPTNKHFSKKAKMKKYERESTKMGFEPKGY